MSENKFLFLRTDDVLYIYLIPRYFKIDVHNKETRVSFRIPNIILLLMCNK